MFWGNRSQKSLAKTYFNLISFLPQSDVVTMFSVSRWPQLSIYKPPVGLSHQTIKQAWDVLITFCLFVSFSKIQTTELKYLCLPGDQLDAFPTLLHPSGEQIRGRESSQEKKGGHGGDHTCVPIFSPHLHHSPQTSAFSRLFSSWQFAPRLRKRRYDTLAALHRFLTSFQLLIALCFAWMRGASADTPHITFGSSLTWLLYICFDFVMQKGGWDCSVKCVIMQ